MPIVPNVRSGPRRYIQAAFVAILLASALSFEPGPAAGRGLGYGGGAGNRIKVDVAGPAGRRARPDRGDAGRPHRPRNPHDPRPPLVAPLIPGGPIGTIYPPSGKSAPARPTASRIAADGRFIVDEVLVSFNANLPPQTVDRIAQNHRLALVAIHRLPLIDIVLYRFRITDRRAVPAVIASLQADGRIATAQPNFLYSLLGDIHAGDPAQYVLGKLRVPQAHELATGSRILIAVIDSAIDTNHPELAGSIAATFDIVRGRAGANAHGTAMASAIAAHGQLLGIAPAARIVAIRAFDATASGPQSTSTRLLDGLQYAANSGARIVNMSFAGPSDPKLHDMVAAIRRQGTVLIAAAGNGGAQAAPAYPAAYPEVIAVTATDFDDHRFAAANRGAYLAVAAPGVDIMVAAPSGAYATTTGTSVAAAHVSGLAALLLERDPGMTPDAIRAVLEKTARDLGPAGRDDDFGAGLVNAEDAMLALTPRSADGELGN